MTLPIPTSPSVRERVAAGEAFLDEREPGWREKIDLDRLDLSEGEDCVLGQIYGDFVDGEDWLELDVIASIELGFDAAGGRVGDETPVVNVAEYDPLTAEWRRVISERRAAS